MKRFLSVLVLALWFLGGMSVAVAASSASHTSVIADPAAAATDVTVDAARAVFDAFKSGNPALGSILVLILVVAALRKYGVRRWPALGSDVGGSALLAAAAFLGVLAAAAASSGWAGVASAGVLWSAFKLAAAAGGGYTLVKRLGGWVLGRWGDRMPGWLHAALDVMLWVFDHSPQASVEIAKAEVAGDAAVAKKPAVGFGPTDALP
jgi:hypothetical protein